MTLVEVLAALSVLSAFVAATAGFLVVVSADHAALEGRLSSRSEIRRCAEAIRADLLERDTTEEPTATEDQLGVLTFHTLPGDVPGLARVVWNVEGGALVRSREFERERSRQIIARGVRGMEVETADDADVLRVVLTTELAAVEIVVPREHVP